MYKTLEIQYQSYPKTLGFLVQLVKDKAMHQKEVKFTNSYNRNNNY